MALSRPLLALLLMLPARYAFAGACDPNPLPSIVNASSQPAPLIPLFVFEQRGAVKLPAIYVVDAVTKTQIRTEVVAGPIKSRRYVFIRPVKPLRPSRAYQLQSAKMRVPWHSFFTGKKTALPKPRWRKAPRVLAARRQTSPITGRNTTLTISAPSVARLMVLKMRGGVQIAEVKGGSATFFAGPCVPGPLDRIASETVQVAVLGASGRSSAYRRLAVKF